MAVTSRSSKRFRERAGLIRTVRGPISSVEAYSNPAHALVLEAPLPLPELLQSTQGSPPPDRGKTQPWPHGAV